MGVSMSPRRSLADDLADRLVNEVLNGVYPTNAVLPSETELAEMSGLSRLTVREAVKSLRAKSVLRVEQGRGTFVNPPDQWSVLDPALLVARSLNNSDRLVLPRKFLEARRIVEVAVAELAAERRTEEDLEALRVALDSMRWAAAVDDVPGFVAADIAFHQTILDAADNPFIASLFDPLSQILRLTRHQTSAHAPVRTHAIDHHKLVYDAITLGDKAKAGAAMRDHLTQTETDMNKYVHDPGESLLSIRAGDGLPASRSDRSKRST